MRSAFVGVLIELGGGFAVSLLFDWRAAAGDGDFAAGAQPLYALDDDGVAGLEVAADKDGIAVATHDPDRPAPVWPCRRQSARHSCRTV